MNSINKNQKEENHKDLSSIEAAEKIKELGEDKTCFFCTSHGSKGTARPMSVQKIDAEGNVWFLSANDSTQNKEIEADPTVNLYFQGNSYSDFMHLYGKASISEDKKIIKELWKPMLKTWFTEGENDPRISVIKFTPEEGYYWINKHGMVVAGIKMLIGAATGKTLDDSLEGELNTERLHKNHIAHG